MSMAVLFRKYMTPGVTRSLGVFKILTGGIIQQHCTGGVSRISKACLYTNLVLCHLIRVVTMELCTPEWPLVPPAALLLAPNPGCSKPSRVGVQPITSIITSPALPQTYRLTRAQTRRAIIPPRCCRGTQQTRLRVRRVAHGPAVNRP